MVQGMVLPWVIIPQGALIGNRNSIIFDNYKYMHLETTTLAKIQLGFFTNVTVTVIIFNNHIGNGYINLS